MSNVCLFCCVYGRFVLSGGNDGICKIAVVGEDCWTKETLIAKGAAAKDFLFDWIEFVAAQSFRVLRFVQAKEYGGDSLNVVLIYDRVFLIIHAYLIENIRMI